MKKYPSAAILENFVQEGSPLAQTEHRSFLYYWNMQPSQIVLGGLPPYTKQLVELLSIKKVELLSIKIN